MSYDLLVNGEWRMAWIVPAGMAGKPGPLQCMELDSPGKGSALEARAAYPFGPSFVIHCLSNSSSDKGGEK